MCRSIIQLPLVVDGALCLAALKPASGLSRPPVSGDPSRVSQFDGYPGGAEPPALIFQGFWSLFDAAQTAYPFVLMRMRPSGAFTYSLPSSQTPVDLVANGFLAVAAHLSEELDRN
jgi:hypothetical protein